MFKVSNKDTTTTPMTSFYCLTVHFEYISHLVPINNFEQVNADWVGHYQTSLMGLLSKMVNGGF